ncbi:hypothetical protein GCM10023259_074990 [Thermocatellispora tengchongensis]
MVASGAPVGATGVTATPSGSVTATPGVQAQSPMPVPTAMTLVIRPTAAGTVALRGEGFVLRAGSGSTTTYYTCQPATAGQGPSLNLAVGTSTGTGSPSPSNTSTGTGTPTPTNSTPRPTTTRTATVTATPPGGNGQVTRTPDGGAATGGGGEMGPDARMFLLVGSLMVLGAGVGGLFLRRRTAANRG